MAMNGKERCRATDHRFDVRFIIACVRACVAVGANALPMKYVMEHEPAAEMPSLNTVRCGATEQQTKK
ncbi:hypothetical protein QT383_02910 [Stenotrophomonas rhizophila]